MRTASGGVILSVAVGAGLGILLVSAPEIAGETAITDPVLLGAMWFMRPASLLVALPPVVHLGVGVLVGVFAQLIPGVSPTAIAIAAVAVNAAGTLLENAYGAGVMGIVWWLMGSLISAALILIGAASVHRVARLVRA